MSGPDRRDLLDLIGRTYDAALDEALWSGLAPDIARTFNSTSTSLRIRNTRTGIAPVLSCTANYALPIMEQYTAYYWRHDRWANRGAELGMSRVLSSKDLISDAELERSEWYQDFLRHLQIYYMVGSVFPIGQHETLTLGIHRQRSGGNYSEADKRPVAQYLPHLRRALQLRRRLADPAIERHAALDALERTGVATLVVAEGGRILYANSQAEEVLHDGSAICAPSGRLGTPDGTAGARLALAIARAISSAAGRSSSSGGALTVEREGRLPLTILVAPFRPARNGFGGSAPAAIVFIRDPEQPTPSRMALQGLFGLTPAKAEIAGALAEGSSVEQIAARHRVSLNTIRTHVRSILAKTGTGRQAELVALLLGSVAALAEK